MCRYIIKAPSRLTKRQTSLCVEFVGPQRPTQHFFTMPGATPHGKQGIYYWQANILGCDQVELHHPILPV